MNNDFCLEVSPEQSGERIDRFLQQNLAGMSRSQAQKWISQGKVLLGEKTAGKNDKVKPGMKVTILLPEELFWQDEDIDMSQIDWEEVLHPVAAPEPENIPLDIVYEDEHLIVVNKPKHMVVHPGAGNDQGTLVNALLYHCKGRLAQGQGIERPGIVHRIDKDTSGLLVCVKDDETAKGLSAQIKEHSVDRYYEAVVIGRPKEDAGTVDLPIGRSPKDRKKMAVLLDREMPDGSLLGAKQAITHYEVIRRYDGFTHIRCRLETGRTHQIRVHMAYLGCPVAGDEVYGPKKAIKRLEGQCLHARALGFTHPITGERLQFESPLPEYFTSFLKTLRPREDDEDAEQTEF